MENKKSSFKSHLIGFRRVTNPMVTSPREAMSSLLREESCEAERCSLFMTGRLLLVSPQKLSSSVRLLLGVLIFLFRIFFLPMKSLS